MTSPTMLHNRMKSHEALTPDKSIFKSPIYINGRFLSQSVTGVQRYATELVNALDQMLDRDEFVSLRSQFCLLLPPTATRRLKLRYIPQHQVGYLHGHVWDQLELPIYARGGLLLSLCSVGPVVHPRQIVTIHDASVFANPENFSRVFRAWYRILCPVLGRRAKKILTVSHFSKMEIARFGIAPEDKIEVIYNGANHMLSHPPSETTFKNHPIVRGAYILAVGNMSPNKNFGLISEAFQYVDSKDIQLVIAGRINSRIFSEYDLSPKGRALWVGHVSDEELRALYENALCFIFPSLYEGFGIPPLEAMACGCPVVVSSAASLPEICGKAALYCDPYNARDLADKINLLVRNRQLQQELRERGLKHAKHFTWDKCARTILASIFI